VNSEADLIVVGQGLSALTSALWLHESGLKSLLVPAREQPDLSPMPDLTTMLPWRVSPMMTALERRGLALVSDLSTRLALEIGVDIAPGAVSMLAVTSLLDDRASDSSSEADELRHGLISDFESQLAEGYQPIVCLPRQPAIRSERMARALDLSLANRGVQRQLRAPAERLIVTGNVVRGVELEDGSILQADATVLAADQASARLLYESGLEGLAGEAIAVPALEFAPSTTALGCALIAPEMMLMPQGGGTILALSALEPGSTCPMTIEQLRSNAHRRLPGLGRHDLKGWGQRPLPGPGSRASIGAYPGIRGLWINTGHDAFGPLFAPAAAEFLAEQLAGGPPVAELQPTFSPSMQPSC